MNIQNISALSDQLKAIGFDNMEHDLIKRVCFIPKNFTICEKISKENELVIFNLYFEQDKKKEYVLQYYDAILQKELALSNQAIDGVDVVALDENMNNINWKTAFDFTAKKSFNPDEKTPFENEQRIELVLRELSTLALSEHGKSTAIQLKQKYWSLIPYSELMGNLTPAKDRTELSQRFYCSEGQPIISADEAYRFLKNKLLEKLIQSQRKEQKKTDDIDAGAKAAGSSDIGMVKKGKGNSSNRFKNSKAKLE
ncbi:hypothetical protein [Lacibacter sp.]|uniref:hypothetical protein n=1 Tax=Lacibacter sp. TaxID=1915409 RepID=UPI002B4B05F0|nr:hypothetical protein [Lacibacter sp.]HLP37774.1 hypothetical protein [Lacibacter sp.]